MLSNRAHGFAGRIAAIALLLGCAAQPLAALAQDDIPVSVLDLVHDCDLLAAHPDDVGRYSDGVGDDQIVPMLAILACEDALSLDPGNARYEFQLGRALLAANRQADALQCLTAAAGRDYAPAHAYLGDIHQFGLGVPADSRRALDAYSKAVAGGFEVARIQIDQLQFSASMYTAEFLPAFFSGDFALVKQRSSEVPLQAAVRNYVFNLVLTMMTECGAVLSPAQVPRLYRYRYPQGWTPDADADVSVAIQTSVSEYDAAAFLRRHGCDGAVAKHVFANMDSFFSTGP